MRRLNKLVLSVFASIAIALLPISTSAQSGNDLFQQALAKERADGHLREAVTLYERIVRDFSANRELTARSLVQIGRVQERMGGNEARKAYERVVREYSDQPAAAVARRRLAVLAEPATAGVQSTAGMPASTQVWVSKDEGVAFTVGGSSGGRLVSYVDHHYTSWGNVAVKDLLSGEVRILTSDADKNQGATGSRTVFSPDNKYIAYAWRLTAPLSSSVRVVSVEDKRVRTILARDTSNTYSLRVYDFTPDGNALIVGEETRKNGQTLMLVSIADGRIRPLFSVLNWPSRVKVSPDGRYIVYDAPQDASQTKKDIFIRRLDGTGESRLVENPANDRTPLWVPGGRGVFFVSDRGGSEAGWYVDVMDGKASGEPRLVKQDIGTTPLSFARDGSLLYSAAANRAEIYVGEIDSHTGRWLREPAALHTLAPGRNGSPSWSRDNLYLAYAAKNGTALRIHELATGKEREFPLPFDVGRSSWSADGKWVSIASLPSPRKSAVYRVNAESGAYEKIVDAPVYGWGTTAAFAPDRNAIYYVNGDTIGADASRLRNRLMRRNLTTGKDDTVYTTDPGMTLADIAVTPDGAAVIAGAADSSGLFLRIPTNGNGPATVLTRTDLRRRISFTSDGKEILHLANPGPGELEIISTPVDGSPSRKLATAPIEPLKHAWEFVLAPDGRHVALRVDDRSVELWTASGFLHQGSPSIVKR